MVGRCALVLTLLLASAAPARAFVRSRTKAGKPLVWSGRCATLVVSIAEPPAPLTIDVWRGATRAAAAAWIRPAVECAGLTMVVTDSPATGAPVAIDRVNNVMFRRSGWPHADEALALTTVTAAVSSGALLDADVEINATDHEWDDVAVNGPGARIHDLQNALTHELGHLLGLDHNCYQDRDLRRPSDHLGMPVPDCVGAPEAIREATMYPNTTPGSTVRRTLEEDDVRAVCAIYPQTTAAPDCSPPPVPAAADGGCDCALGRRAPARGGWPWAFVAVVALRRARRRPASLRPRGATHAAA